MFGIAPLYLKIFGWVAAVGLIYGGYAYVKNLNQTIDKLKVEKVQVEQMNETLTESIAEVQRMQQVRDDVGGISQEIRKENRQIRERRDASINNSVSENKDRAVGPLLKEFFNAN